MSEPTHNQVYRFVYRFVHENDCPFVKTKDLAEEFSSPTKRTLRGRLNDLVEEGRLKSREVGGSGKVWYLPDQKDADASSSSPSSVNQ